MACGRCVLVLALACQLAMSYSLAIPVPAAEVAGLTPAQQAWLDAVAHGDTTAGDFPQLSAVQAASLASSASSMAKEQARCCMPFGQSVNTKWQTGSNQTIPEEYEDVGDSAAWTGHVLAAAALEYNVTKSASTLEFISKTLDMYDFTTQCSGKVGFIVRFAGPSNNMAYRNYYHGSNHAWPCVAPWGNQTWLGSLSKDMYYGFAFGMSTTWVFVDDAATRAKVSMLVQRVVSLLAKDSFFINSPKPHIPIVPDPLFIAVFMRLGLSINETAYHGWSTGSYLDWLRIAQDTDMTLSSKWADPYFPNHLSIESQFVLLILEHASGGNNAKSVLDSMATFVTDGTTHLIADFYGFYLAALKLVGATPASATANATIPVAVAEGLLQGLLLDFQAIPIMNKAVNLTSSPEYEPHHDADHSEFAVMPSQRVPDSYMWQRAPTRLVGGDNDGQEMQTEAFTLPYWLGVYAGSIPSPAVE